MKDLVQISASDLKNVISEMLISSNEKKFFLIYKNRKVTADVAAILIGCTIRSVYRLAEQGRLICYPHSPNEAYYFDLSTILEFIYYNKS